MARSFTIIQDGESRSFTIETGVGPQGPAGETGATGATGSTGATGPAGSDASVTAANVASAINGTSEKTTPVDSDVLSLLDSAASWAMKKLSWSNIKATLKLYFDTLYMAVTGLDGVMVTKATGTRRCYVASSDTDTARGLALEAAFAAASAGDTIDLSPGNYYVAKTATNESGIYTQFTVLDKMTIRFNGARLYHTATEATRTMFSAANGSSASDWSILGPGIIEGSDSTVNDSAGTGENGINIAGNNGSPRRWRIADLTIRYFTNQGIVFNATSYSGHGTSINANLKISTGQITNCHLDYNNIGFFNVTSSEYCQLINCTMNNCRTGCDIYAGNTCFSNCDANACIRYGVMIRNGGNDGHGSWNGGRICHNVGFAFATEASMDYGFIFAGVLFAGDGNTYNKLQSLGGGVIIANCYVESPFYASATPTGLNKMVNCFISGTYTTVTDLSAAERLQWIFEDNFTLTGGWAKNDVMIYAFADDAAAGTGGMTAGRKYRNSSTHAIAVKQ